jgi:hypothetical protein
MVQSNDQNGIASRASIEKFDLAQSRQACAVQNILRGKTVRVVRWLTLRALDRTGNRYGQGRIYFAPSADLKRPVPALWFKTIRLVTVC